MLFGGVEAFEDLRVFFPGQVLGALAEVSVGPLVKHSSEGSNTATARGGGW